MGWLADALKSTGDKSLESGPNTAFNQNGDLNINVGLPPYKLFTCDVCCSQFHYLKSYEKHRLNHALEGLHHPFQRPSSAASDGRSERSERSESEISEAVSATVHRDNSKVPNETIGLSAAGPSVPKLESLPAPLVKHDSAMRPETALRLGMERPPFACPFCGKCVRLKENLKLHIRKHTGERPFSCIFCGRAFGGKSDLTRHQRIHTGERPYHCDTCGKRFARADYLSKHLATHNHHPHHQR